MAFVTPGVFSREIDLSLFAQKLSTSVFAMVGGFTKGPINKRTLVSNVDQLIATFGPPPAGVNADPRGQGWHHIRQYLLAGSQAIVVRVADPTKAKSSANLNKTGPTNIIQFESATEGTWVDGYQVKVSAAAISGVKIELFTGDGIRLLTLSNVVNERDAIIAAFNDAVADIVAVDIAGAPTDPVVEPQTAIFSGGADGISGLTDSMVIGTSTGATHTGLKLFANPEVVDVNMIAAPGFQDEDINVELLTIAETRADCLAILDTPFNLDVTGVLDFHNGQAPFTVSYDSSYGAMYWSWVLVKDEFNDEDVWISPVGFAAFAMAFTDQQTETWFAPAGLRRGKLRRAKSVEYSPSLGEREFLQGPGANINPIVDFVKDGLTIYGQKTLQRAPTALDRVNVRRMMLVIEKTIASASRFIVFEPNDESTRRQWINLVTPVLDSILANRGIKQFAVIMDDSNNSVEDEANNIMRGKVVIEPVKAAETIVLDFVLTPTGADFTEILQAA